MPRNHVYFYIANIGNQANRMCLCSSSFSYYVLRIRTDRYRHWVALKYHLNHCNMEVSTNGGTPSHRPFLHGIFPFTKTIQLLGVIPIWGNLHMETADFEGNHLRRHRNHCQQRAPCQETPAGRLLKEGCNQIRLLHERPFGVFFLDFCWMLEVMGMIEISWNILKWYIVLISSLDTQSDVDQIYPVQPMIWDRLRQSASPSSQKGHLSKPRRKWFWPLV